MDADGVQMVALVLQRMLTHRGGERKPFRAELIFWPAIITLTNVRLLIFRALVSWKPSLTWDPFQRRDPGVGFESGRLKRGLGRVHVPGTWLSTAQQVAPVSAASFTELLQSTANTLAWWPRSFSPESFKCFLPMLKFPVHANTCLCNVIGNWSYFFLNN